MRSCGDLTCIWIAWDEKKDLQCDLQVFFVALTFLHSIDYGI